MLNIPKINYGEVELLLDTKWKNIAISLSGGSDSALLAYLICDNILKENSNSTIHIISHVRCWKTKPWQAYDSLRVYEWLEQKFTKINFQRHVNFIAPDLEWADKGPTIVDEYGKLSSGDIIEIRAFAEYVCYKYNIDAYYNGVTRNPRNVNFQGMPSRDIDPSDDNCNLEKTQHMGKWSFHPFRFTDKSWIIKKYYEFNLEDLLNSTRSCEGEFDNMNYKTYTPGQHVPTCGECFWCKEREWAIEQSK
jgi:hypothetical protein